MTKDFKLFGVVTRGELVETAYEGCGEARVTRSEREVMRGSEKRRGVTCAVASEHAERGDHSGKTTRIATWSPYAR